MNLPDEIARLRLAYSDFAIASSAKYESNRREVTRRELVIAASLKQRRNGEEDGA